MNVNQTSRSLRFPIAIVALLLIVTITSCARKAYFTSSAVAPQAQGKVKVKKDGNDNYRISMDIKNIPQSNELVPARSTYVVWMESSNGTKNIGQLKTSTGLFSSTRKAALQTTSPYRPIRVFITAEDIPDVPYPGSQIIISTNTF